jgi:preprotein translocase subunit SecE
MGALLGWQRNRGAEASETARRRMAEEAGSAKNAFREFRQYVTEVRAEMKRVTWPGKQEIYGTTVMVILTTFLFGLYFFVSDQIFSTAVLKVMNAFLHRG